MKWLVMFYLLVPLFSVLHAYAQERSILSDKEHDPILVEYYLSHFELRMLDMYACGWLHGSAAFLNHWLLWPAFIWDDIEIIRQISGRVDCFLSRYPDIFPSIDRSAIGIEWSNGHGHWYQNGEYHREDVPAIEYSDGTKHLVE